MNVGTKVLLAFPKGTIKARNKPNGKILSARPSRIIVFEDNPGISSSIGETLVRAGHQVEVYTNAKAGLVRLRETSFDLVLTDLGMPGITGWDVGKEVKKTSSDTPVILLTGWGADHDPKALEESGIVESIAKPFRRETLLNAIAKVLNCKENKKIV